MDVASDSSATEALIRAAILAEETRIPTPHSITADLGDASPRDHRLTHHAPPLKSSRGSRNPVKSSAPPPAIDLNNALLSEWIDSLQRCALIGQWHFPVMDKLEMRKWLSDWWKPIIGYTPIISHLMRDWFCFHFLDAADSEIILRAPWVFKRSFLALHRWFIGFDPLKNTPSHNLIWVKLPNLPLEMWSKEIMEIIGNSIGRFIYADPWIIGERDKRIAWILIDRAFRGGYPEHVDISWHGIRISQRLDFWGIPFRCAACHKTGHLIEACPRRDAHRRRFPHHRTSSRRHPPANPIPSSPPSPGIPSAQIPIGLPPSPPPHAPIPEPINDPPIRSPSPIPVGDFSIGSLPIFISSSSPPRAICSLTNKGKEPMMASTPVNSPSSTPVNNFDSDVDLLLHRRSVELEPLTIHRPPHPNSPTISPASGLNITVRKTARGGTRHFRGRSNPPALGDRSFSLIDVPIFDMSSSLSQPLRADLAGASKS